MQNQKTDIIFFTKEEDLKKLHAEDKVIRKKCLENKKAAAQHNK